MLRLRKENSSLSMDRQHLPKELRVVRRKTKLKLKTMSKGN